MIYGRCSGGKGLGNKKILSGLGQKRNYFDKIQRSAVVVRVQLGVEAIGFWSSFQFSSAGT